MKYIIEGQENPTEIVLLSLIEQGGNIILAGTIPQGLTDEGSWIIATISTNRNTVELNADGMSRVGLKGAK